MVRHDKYTRIEIGPNMHLSLHQSEMFGPRYQFYLTMDRLHVNILSVEDARKLYEAFGKLLAQVEEEQA